MRLVPADGGKTVVITPDAVNPYCVDFSVPLSVAAGNYYVEVSANSAEYGRDLVREYPEVVKATVVQVEPAPTNPTALALKVAWANDFNWTRVADAKRDFHAQGDGSTDDTRAIQNALDHVSQSGGGVVFLPQGVYKVNNLVLGSKCILQGESREETVVMVSKIGDDGAIVPKGSAQGMSTMTLKYQPSVSARSSALLIAGAANKFFIHNIKFDLLRIPDVSVHQSPHSDCLDAEATSDNTEGWNNWGRIGEFPGSKWHCPVYFNQLKRSTFIGISPTYSTMGITLRVENETKNYRGIGDYGTEIRDNTIDRAACANMNQRLAGNAAIATFNQSWMKVTADTPLIFAMLCEGNRIKNSSVGFDLNESFSFAIRGTSYENCPKSINDKGHDTALLAGAPSPLRPLPAGAAQGRFRTE